MILNVSGRTDIPAFYSEWFMNRLDAGYVDVRNPFYYHQVSRIYFKDVDLLFFCTKNPIPIIDKIDKIKLPIYFHVTITPYLKDIEPGVPSKEEVIKAVINLSKKIGKDKIVIRYDPIFLSERYPASYHVKAFERLCSLLEGYVSKILIHFVNSYKNTEKNMATLKYHEPNEEELKLIGTSFSKSAHRHGIQVFTCTEENNLTQYGFDQDECISEELAYQLTGKVYKTKWSKTRSVVCKCIQMVDIGTYNCCQHFCKYCYANYDEKQVHENYLKHNPKSSLLIGELEEEDVIKVRTK